MMKEGNTRMMRRSRLLVKMKVAFKARHVWVFRLRVALRRILTTING